VGKANNHFPQIAQDIAENSLGGSFDEQKESVDCAWHRQEILGRPCPVVDSKVVALRLVEGIYLVVSERFVERVAKI